MFVAAIGPEITRFTFNFTDALEAGTVVKGEYMDMCYGLHFFERIQNLHEQVQRHRHPHSVASTIPP